MSSSPTSRGATAGGMAPGAAAHSRASRRWAQARWVVGTILAVVLVGFMDMAFAVLGVDTEVFNWTLVWHALGLLAGVGSGFAMIWRRSHPLHVLGYCLAAAFLTPAGPVGALGGLTWVLASASERVCRWAVAATAGATALALWRDWNISESAALLSYTAPDGVVTQASATWYVVIGAFAVALAVAVGLVRRYRAGQAAALGVVSQRDAVVADLQGEVDRKEERERIARELHDTVAHHLSMVSLQATALELSSTDPEVPENARAMRDSAHRALEEMRAIVDSLRDSSSDGYAGKVRGLDQLNLLIADARAAGARIEATIQVAEPQAAPVGLGAATYRIVQEALTNAVKHGANAGIRVQVSGAPGRGVQIVVVNWLAPVAAPVQPRAPWAYPHPGSGQRADHVPSVPGGGAGMIGMRERAETLGGGLLAGVNGSWWVVQAWLPWREA